MLEDPMLTRPHGGALKPLLLSQEEAKEHRQRSEQDRLPRLRLSSRELGDLEMLAMGAFSPLDGFMRRDDWLGVCQAMRMTDGLFWPIPITLATTKEMASALKPGRDALLCDADERAIGQIRVSEVYQPDKDLEATAVFGTQDKQHPGVATLYAHQEYYVGGPVRVFAPGRIAKQWPDHCLTPMAIRRRFKELGWRKVVAFQTRNPLHRAHEHITKDALRSCDGLLIHSTLGRLKQGDLPAEVRLRAIDALLAKYYAKNRALSAGYPLEMRYAGPREALLHALFRQNYGCSHLIIGRDHAGVGDYYGPYDAQRIFAQIPQGALAIKPLKMEWVLWCARCQKMTAARDCPHDLSNHLLLSGTQLRQLLSAGAEVPPHFSRPEVLAILRAYYAMEGQGR